MRQDCELSERTSVRAFYESGNLLLAVEGELPTPAFVVDIEQSPIDVFPPEFSLLRCRRPGFFPQVVVPFRYSETFQVGSRPDQVTVHHAEGSDAVAVEQCGQQLAPYGEAVGAGAAQQCPPGADEATGFSKNLSIDEAFADALAKLPPITPEHPDTLETVRVAEIGAFFGGIAGFRDVWVRVCRTHD